MTRIGSMFSGAGGLDVAVESLTDGDTVWHAEIDKHASAVLDARWPGVPNLGSVTEVDWATVEAVDVLVAGFPCQDVSQAGLRAGLAGRRSGLFSEVIRAIDALRPRAVVIENVRGLLSSKDAETGERAIDVVLAGLAGLGYSTRWVLFPAAAIGAPHLRERVFIVGYQSDEPSSLKLDRPGVSLPTSKMLPTPTVTDMGIRKTIEEWDDWCEMLSARHNNGAGHGRSLSIEVRRHARLPTPRAGDGRHGMHNPAALRHAATGEGSLPEVLGSHVFPASLLPTPQARDSCGVKSPEQIAARRSTSGGPPRNLNEAVVNHLLPTPRARDGKGKPKAGFNKGNLPPAVVSADWGRYADAIRVWEGITRPAPVAVEANTKGGVRMAAVFPEWMMGWPSGWVTDVVPTYTHAIKIIGNGVVAHQAEAALAALDLPALVGIES